MKKLILMLALFSAVVMGANAQIATQNSNGLDNIGIGVTAGVSTPLDFNSIFPLNTNVGLKITKDITPVIGFQLEGLAMLNDNHFSKAKTVVKAFNVGVNGTINLSNALWGYKGTPRTFEVSTVAGIGWLHECDIVDNSLTAKTGLDFAINLGKAKAHSLVITPAVYWNLNKIDHIQFNKHASQLAVNLTYVYHFKTSNGTHHFKTYDIGAMNDEINQLKAELAKKPTVVKEVIKEPVVVTNGTTKWVIPFEYGKSTLTNEAKFVLNQIGENAIVDVTATASPEGSVEFNQKLSEARAKSVADFLTNRGVKVNSAVGKGIDPTKGKTAVVTTVQ